MIVIVGPTAAGKSAAALARAPEIGGEIVSADSRHIYRSMNIGTNKPTLAEQAQVPHHLLDLRDVHESFSLAEYVKAARTVIADIRARGKTPMLVGGTGQYVRALVEGWQVPEVPPNDAFRQQCLTFEQTEGPDALFAKLLQKDPGAGLTIDKRNIRRVVRALEVIDATGKTWSELQRHEPPSEPIEWIYVNHAREKLYNLVDSRLMQMLELGWADETRSILAALAARGIDADMALTLPAMSALGYREIAQFVLGRIRLDEAVDSIKRETRRFIRMQDTWFRKMVGEN